MPCHYTASYIVINDLIQLIISNSQLRSWLYSTHRWSFEFLLSTDTYNRCGLRYLFAWSCVVMHQKHSTSVVWGLSHSHSYITGINHYTNVIIYNRVNVAKLRCDHSNHMHKHCNCLQPEYVTGPGKTGLIYTKYTCLYYSTYLLSCMCYPISVNFIEYPMDFCIDDDIFRYNNMTYR